MENQTAFDLNHAIQQWRGSMAPSPAYQNDNLNELESHLRDSIAAWQTKGLSEHEAFLIALRRIGAAPQLETEFKKVNRNAIWFERLLWMLIGVQAWTFVNSVAGITTQHLLLFGSRNSWFEGGVTFPLLAFTLIRSLLVIGSAWGCGWLIIHNSGNAGRWLAKKLQPRASFLGCCIAASLLLFVGQGLFFVLQSYWIWRFGPSTFGQRTAYLSYSQVITHFVEFLVMVIFILALARKRLVSKSA